jgi:hypothetical protein
MFAIGKQAGPDRSHPIASSFADQDRMAGAILNPPEPNEAIAKEYAIAIACRVSCGGVAILEWTGAKVANVARRAELYFG